MSLESGKNECHHFPLSSKEHHCYLLCFNDTIGKLDEEMELHNKKRLNFHSSCLIKGTVIAKLNPATPKMILSLMPEFKKKFVKICKNISLLYLNNRS